MKSFKMIALGLLAAICMIGLSTPSNAQAGKKAKANKKMERGIKALEQLNLTDEQKAKIKPIVAEEHKAMMAVHEDTKLADDLKRAKQKEIRKDTMKQIAAILTPEQRAKLKAMRHKAKGAPAAGAPAKPAPTPEPKP